MRAVWINSLLLAFLCACNRPAPSPDGRSIEDEFLASNNVRRDFSAAAILPDIVAEVNCMDSGIFQKRIVLASRFQSTDTNEILLIPYSTNGTNLGSSAYSDLANRVILLNPVYIRLFARKNTLDDTLAYQPLMALMLLHEIGHFILGKPGFFDRITTASGRQTGEQRDDNQPEFLTSVKKIELAADSLAIDLVKRKIKTDDPGCNGLAFDIQLIVPGMEFQLSGMRVIDNFGSSHLNFLHDPNPDHPNLELRITFMNYFLAPNDTLRQMIDDYLYERTAAPVHRQETDPRIFQGREKQLPKQ